MVESFKNRWSHTILSLHGLNNLLVYSCIYWVILRVFGSGMLQQQLQQQQLMVWDTCLNINGLEWKNVPRSVSSTYQLIAVSVGR